MLPLELHFQNWYSETQKSPFMVKVHPPNAMIISWSEWLTPQALWYWGLSISSYPRDCSYKEVHTPLGTLAFPFLYLSLIQFFLVVQVAIICCKYHHPKNWINTTTLVTLWKARKACFACSNTSHIQSLCRLDMFVNYGMTITQHNTFEFALHQYYSLLLLAFFLIYVAVILVMHKFIIVATLTPPPRQEWPISSKPSWLITMDQSIVTHARTHDANTHCVMWASTRDHHSYIMKYSIPPIHSLRLPYHFCPSHLDYIFFLIKAFLQYFFLVFWSVYF